MMKKLIPLFGILLAAIVVMSTGAFTSVTADRDATINVANDASALLGLDASTGPNGEYADTDTDGKLVIAINNLNKSATTVMNDVFVVQNNGTQDVQVTITWDDAHLAFSSADDGFTSTTPTVGASSITFDLDSGATKNISIAIQSETANISETITITAEAVSTA